MWKCPNCNYSYEDDMISCSKCGYIRDPEDVTSGCANGCLSLIILVIFVITGFCFLFYYDSFFSMFLCCVIGMSIYMIRYKNSEEKKERIISRILAKKRKQEQNEISQYVIDSRNNRVKKWGNISSEYECRLLGGTIYFYEIYEDKSVLIIGSYRDHLPYYEEINEFNFSNIISAEIIEKGRVINSISTQNGNVTSNTGSMIGRAVVGGVVSGGTGAVIGGITGKKTINTTINTETEEVINYRLSITVNDINNPVKYYDFSTTSDEIDYMQKLYSILKVIITNER